MTPSTIPMTQAIRALKAAKAEFELLTYDFTPHGGTAECAAELKIDHHAAIKTIILPVIMSAEPRPSELARR